MDIDPERIRESRENVRRAGVADRVSFVNQDALTTEFRDATVVMLFLTHELNQALRPRLQGELRPGSRIVSHYHGMNNWEPEMIRHVRGDFGIRTVFLWTVPVR